MVTFRCRVTTISQISWPLPVQVTQMTSPLPVQVLHVTTPFPVQVVHATSPDAEHGWQGTQLSITGGNDQR